MLFFFYENDLKWKFILSYYPCKWQISWTDVITLKLSLLASQISGFFDQQNQKKLIYMVFGMLRDRSAKAFLKYKKIMTLNFVYVLRISEKD